ncbi:hypothetical protein L3556_02710 [Candidatus Synechococcus calcipolaris G9]|uniref:Uncharacterized protein n=1 Tax=Candidatus Synechococcus calcipolaris G9 TaxID=1497997 RepID=A0ABT6EVP8_9SYNE|nr:hypothetical protein [Candidatus Synechococcus calcipolaris]MDG2989850.1 hypothetical protein [Candidatus Synechococcus calcipolaris G9]
MEGGHGPGGDCGQGVAMGGWAWRWGGLGHFCGGRGYGVGPGRAGGGDRQMGGDRYGMARARSVSIIRSGDLCGVCMGELWAMPRARRPVVGPQLFSDR